jgi:hypothetical protein
VLWLDALIGGPRNSELRLFDDYFVWEEERSAAVVKPHQIHSLSRLSSARRMRGCSLKWFNPC